MPRKPIQPGDQVLWIDDERVTRRMLVESVGEGDPPRLTLFGTQGQVPDVPHHSERALEQTDEYIPVPAEQARADDADVLVTGKRHRRYYRKNPDYDPDRGHANYWVR